jgi:tetratricopeptide (TPR) repeat protein
VWEEKKELDKALEDLSKALELDPDYKDAADNRKRVLKKKEEG